MIDRRGKLEEEPFSFHITKDKKVQVGWNGRTVMIIKDKKAKDIINKLERADSSEVQLILAKVTGNFKRGNER